MADFDERYAILQDKICARLSSLDESLQNCADSLSKIALEEERLLYTLDIAQILCTDEPSAGHRSAETAIKTGAQLPAQPRPRTKAAKRQRRPHREQSAYLSVSCNSVRNSLIARYKHKIDRSQPRTSDYLDEVEDPYTCPCGSEDIVERTSEGCMVCLKCALCRPSLIDIGLSFEEEKQMTWKCSFAYQRINHLKELLAQVQGKQQTDIPEHILDRVRLELKKQRIHDIESITMAKVSKILRSLKLIKYYEHSNYICYLITGKQPLHMAEPLERKLYAMFDEMQGPWERHKPPDRHNFLSYHYTLYQMCKLLGADAFLPCFNLLKSPEKLHKTNVQWKKICEDLQWPYYPAETY